FRPTSSPSTVADITSRPATDYTVRPKIMITKLLAGFALCLLLVSCGASVQSSESYYRPTVMQTFPPKPKDAHIPILASMPKEKGGTIGIMEFSTNKGADFINKCLIHNARKNGGDAVIILAQGSSASQVPFTMPGYTTYQPQTTY